MNQIVGRKALVTLVTSEASKLRRIASYKVIIKSNRKLVIAVAWRERLGQVEALVFHRAEL